MRTTAPAVALLALALAGCSAGVKDSKGAAPAASDTAAGAASQGSASQGTSSSSAAEGAPAGDTGACFTGTYRVDSITSQDSVDLDGQSATVHGTAAGLTLTFDNGHWTLAGSSGRVDISVEGISATATVNGRTEGEYARIAGGYGFHESGSSGTVTLTVPGVGHREYPMDDLAKALAPSGTATVTCSGGTVTLDSPSVRVQMTRGGSGGGTPPSSGNPGGGSTGGTLSYSNSDQTATIPCNGRVISINGSDNHLTFTGSCATVSVNGSNNVLDIDSARLISLNGGGNTVSYGGNAVISDNGSGNHVRRR